MRRSTKRMWAWGIVLPLLMSSMYACGGSSDGGSEGSPRPGGASCSENSECASGACLGGSCADGKPGGASCSADSECVSGACSDGECSGNGVGVPPGGGCSIDADCASNDCKRDKCAPGTDLPDGKSCATDGECAGGECDDGVCSTPGGSSGSGGSSASGGAGNGSGLPPGSACTSPSECSSGLCTNGTCAEPSGGGGGTTTPGPHFPGSGNGFRPLTPGCGPDTASQCTGACEQAGGDPDVEVIRPPATLCFAGEGDTTPDDPAVVIEQSIETLNGQSYVHLRVTFDPAFVDNTYGTGSCCGWPERRGHTMKDLTGSDHTELLLTDANGNTVMNFKMDYVTANAATACGIATLGVLGGDGEMIEGDPAHVLAVATALDRNLNGCGYCESPACEGGDCRVNSPATDENYTPHPDAPNWDYRQVYEVWVDNAAFNGAGFGQAYVTYVHASPSKGQDTLQVEPTPCPEEWDQPYCPPDVAQEGRNCFGQPTGSGGSSGTGGSGSGVGGSSSGVGGSSSGVGGSSSGVGGSSSGTGGTTGGGGTGSGSCPPNWQIYISTEGKSMCTPIPFANYPGMAPCPEGYVLDVATEGRYCLPSP